MKKSVMIFRAISFFLLFLVLFGLATEILQDKRTGDEYDVTNKVRGFYEEPDNSLDFVFVGSSQLYAHIAPPVLWREYGITSYDFAANEQPMWISYYYIKEALKHQNPKAIILDVFAVYGAGYEEEGVNHINLDDLPWSLNKIAAIQTAVPEELRYSFYLGIAKYHSTWNTLDETKFKESFRRERDPNKGYSPFLFEREYLPSAKEEVVNTTEMAVIPDMSKEWLLKIIELTRAENVDLILTKTPNGNPERQKFYNSVAVLAEQQGVPFVNMNTVLDGEAHINIMQAEKVTKYIGEYLMEHYEIEDKRENPAYTYWNEDVQCFYRSKAQYALLTADSTEEFLRLLKDEGYLVLISAKSSPGTVYDAGRIALLNELGLSCRLHEEPGGYIAVLDGTNVLFEAHTTEDYTTEETPLLSRDVFASGLEIRLTSTGLAADGAANIYIDGVDFSLGYDGINIAVYDKLLGDAFERVALDANAGLSLVRE